jgi:hypothetical protein
MSDTTRILTRDKAKLLRRAVILGGVAVVLLAIGTWSGDSSGGTTWPKATTTTTATIPTKPDPPKSPHYDSPDPALIELFERAGDNDQVERKESD